MGLYYTWGSNKGSVHIQIAPGADWILLCWGWCDCLVSSQVPGLNTGRCGGRILPRIGIQDWPERGCYHQYQPCVWGKIPNDRIPTLSFLRRPYKQANITDKNEIMNAGAPLLLNNLLLFLISRWMYMLSKCSLNKSKSCWCYIYFYVDFTTLR